MLHNHLYETIMLFLTGVGFGIYLYELRQLYNRTHPQRRWAQRPKTTDAKKHATRSV